MESNPKIQEALDNVMFPSPFGEEVMERFSANNEGVWGFKFPSPFGEEVMERFNIAGIDCLLQGFHPLSGKRLWKAFVK